jgi:alkanesulfonate monooxygenase SsuD/methylene tetrahydromethanopterin reductase-like flavin-dependent oxidoreductase (luciferase family)
VKGPPFVLAATRPVGGIHEVSGGRFQFGIGVAHAPSHVRMGVTPGKPLADIRAFVAKIRSYEGIGALPPIILAALRRRMVTLAAEIADGLVFANGSRSHMTAALGAFLRPSAMTQTSLSAIGSAPASAMLRPKPGQCSGAPCRITR